MSECLHENPREWDNVGVFLGFHRRYNLGDKIEPSSEYHLNTEEFESWDEIEAHIYKHFDPAAVFRVFMMDHSGLSFNVEGYGGWNGHFDSGCVGFIFTTKEKARELYGWERISRKRLNLLESYLVDEIKTYDDWHSGTCCYEEENQDEHN